MPREYAGKRFPALGVYGSRRWQKLTTAGLQSLALFVFWLVLSGRNEVKYLAIGALTSGLILFTNRDLLYGHPSGSRQNELPHLFTICSRLPGYVLWLLFNIAKANIQLAYLVMHPRMPIDPALFLFKTELPAGAPQVVLANSITLTPGTVTVDLTEGNLLIHALLPQTAEVLTTARMQNKIAGVFGEKIQQAPKIFWARRLEELSDEFLVSGIGYPCRPTQRN